MATTFGQMKPGADLDVDPDGVGPLMWELQYLLEEDEEKRFFEKLFIIFVFAMCYITKKQNAQLFDNNQRFRSCKFCKNSINV